MPDSSTPPLSDSQVFEILQNPRRRAILRCLNRADGEVDFDDLVDQVAAWENETSVEELETAQRRRVYVSLIQSHIPKLEDSGIIEYDDDRKVIERRPAAGQLDPYLDGESNDSSRWPLVYLTVGLGAFAVTIAHWFQFPPLASVPPLLLAGGIVGLFLVLSVAQFRYDS